MGGEMKNKELLELAAKAAGYKYSETGGGSRHDPKPGIIQPYVRWNPLTDDGDALRLAVKCRIEFYEGAGDGPEAWAGYYLPGVNRQKFACAPHDNDPYAATRRAIVRAAAEIGKGMK